MLLVVRNVPDFGEGRGAKDARMDVGGWGRCEGRVQKRPDERGRSKGI